MHPVMGRSTDEKDKEKCSAVPISGRITDIEGKCILVIQMIDSSFTWRGKREVTYEPATGA